MDLQAFRTIFDQTSTEIEASAGDLVRLYTYMGLESQGHYQSAAVTDALYGRVRAAFTSGHGTAWQTCRSLQTDLIREHVLLGAPLDPYFEVIFWLRDALNQVGRDQGEVVGDWAAAVQAARDFVAISSLRIPDRERSFAREFSVA